MKSIILFASIIIPFTAAAKKGEIQELWQSKQCNSTTIKDTKLIRRDVELRLPFDERIVNKISLDSVIKGNHFNEEVNNGHFELNEIHFVFTDSIIAIVHGEEFQFYTFIINQADKPWTEDSGWLACYSPKIGFLYFMENHTNIEQVHSFILERTSFSCSRSLLSDLKPIITKRIFHLNCW